MATYIDGGKIGEFDRIVPPNARLDIYNTTMWKNSFDGRGDELPCNASVVVGDAVYYNTTNNRVEKADASAYATAAEFIVVEKPSSTTAVCAAVGLSTVHSGLTAGNDYYLSTTAGAITATPPSSPGEIVQRIGRAKSTTELILMIDPTPVELA